MNKTNIKFESNSNLRAKYKFYLAVSNYSVGICFISTFILLFINSDFLTIFLPAIYILTIFILTVFWFNYNIKTRTYILLTVVILLAVVLFLIFPKSYGFLEETNPMLNH